MRGAIKHALLVAGLSGLSVRSIEAQVSGYATDIGKTGLEAVASGLTNLGIGIAVAGIAIGLGLVIRRK
jgi:hypothetical protein